MSIRFIDSHLNEEYLTKYGKDNNVLIETGTFRGDTILIGLEHGFDEIYSCELFVPLYNDCVKMFSDKKNVHIYNTDSPDFLKDIFHNVMNPFNRSTIWLDAHASGPLPGGKSGGTPVIDELKSIRDYSRRNDHTIFIDDRRLFGSDEWSGVKEEDAIKLIKEINTDYVIEFLDGVIEKDIIVAYIP